MTLMVNSNIRLTNIEDIGLLRDIEDSSGKRFREIPSLAWIADDDAMSPETHLLYVTQSTSWVAEVDNQMVGFVCAESVDEDLHVWLLAVQLEWQGKGIGRQLMKTVIEHAHLNKFLSVTLTTFRDVPWNEPFYRALGFEIIDSEMIDSRLKKILDDEIQHGLPGDLRCAMQLLLSSKQE
ncbi:MAG: GNAT family N-acetyltransferase [Chloroflexi bacterium HGW-Chloroflexi-5]|jgi:GNAT superfamily N-acetyltransferase|nr:MAG: GNAT family N-acetyltransferase [Chloroflexi bacterium HGW-Chloroflexi-5]